MQVCGIHVVLSTVIRGAVGGIKINFSGEKFCIFIHIMDMDRVTRSLFFVISSSTEYVSGI